MLRVGLDLDEVVANTLPQFIGFYNNHYGTSLKYQDFHSYRFEDVISEPMEVILERIVEFYHSPFGAQIQPVDGAVEVISDLLSHCEFIAITARPNPIIETTEKWLKDHYHGLIDTVHFAHNIHINCERKKKVDYCKELAIDVLVDDLAENLMGCKEAGVLPLLFDRPWNAKAQGDHFKRINGWVEIKDLLLQGSPQL